MHKIRFVFLPRQPPQIPQHLKSPFIFSPKSHLLYKDPYTSSIALGKAKKFDLRPDHKLHYTREHTYHRSLSDLSVPLVKLHLRLNADAFGACSNSHAQMQIEVKKYSQDNRGQMARAVN